MEPGDVILPFGKHKNEKISDAPIAYLDWLIGQDWLRPELRTKMQHPEWKFALVPEKP